MEGIFQPHSWLADEWPCRKELHCPTGFIPRPHSGFGGAKARVLRPSKVPWSRDLPSCHLCHQFHACLSHPETEHKDHEMISKFPVPPKHQRKMVQKQSLTLAPLAPLEPCGGNERGVKCPSRAGLSPSTLQSPHQLSLRHSAQLCTPLGPTGSLLLAQAAPAGGVDVGAHSRLQQHAAAGPALDNHTWRHWDLPQTSLLTSPFLLGFLCHPREERRKGNGRMKTLAAQSVWPTSETPLSLQPHVPSFLGNQQVPCLLACPRDKNTVLQR